MFDEPIDAVIQRLEVRADPDPSFAASSVARLVPLVEEARRQDATAIGRIRRDVQLSVRHLWDGTQSERVALVGAVALLGLLLLASLLALAGATRTPSLSNGSLVLALDGELRAFDMTDGSFRVIGSLGGPAAHVSRSPDGRLVSSWLAAREGDQLFVVGLNGERPRRIAADRKLSWTGCIDRWSPDSRLIATSVTSDGAPRILVVDSATGTSTFVTGAGVEAECEVWSNDGRWLAVNEGPPDGPRRIAIVRPDGSGLKIVSADLGDVDAEGVNSWSPDGKWIYFGGDRSIWRTNVVTSTSERLTSSRALSVAPALSPDGTRLAYLLDTPTNWDLYVANPDGTDPTLLLQNARNNGWSPDGRYIVARWLPPDEQGGIALVSPEGSGFRLVVPAAEACPDRDQGCDLTWGQPKP
jgi:tricorn protease-like protein